MEKSLNNNQKVIDYLLFLRDREIEKPQNEMDFDLIEACVGLLLDLQNKKSTLSPEQIEEKVSKIPFGTPQFSLEEKPKGATKKLKKKKILLIAAIIVIIATLLAFVSIASEWTIFREIRQRFGNPDDMPYEEVINVNKESFFRYDPEFCGTLEEAKVKGIVDFLVPKNFEGCPEIEEIASVKLKDKEYISVRFKENLLNYTVYINEKLPQYLLESEAVKVKDINGKECYIEYLYDVKAIQVHFEFNGDYYFVSYNYNDISEKKLLFQIIENLEVLE